MIDSNNKLSSLSKGLLDSVRQVMEGKKLDQVGKETKDIDNDGDVDKTDKYLNNRREVRSTAIKLTKGWGDGGKSMRGNYGKLAKEEVERIEELSKQTLGNYIKKAGEDRADHDIATKHATNALNDMRHGSPARADMRKTFTNSLRKSDNRGRGIETAIDKLTREGIEFDDYLIDDEEFGVGSILDVQESYVEVMFDHGIERVDNEDLFVEEVEDIQELSTDTLRSYRQKAKNDPAFAKKKGKPSKATLAVRAKRTEGMAKADSKISDAYAKKAAEEEKIHHENVQHVRKHIGSVLEKNGYTKMTTHAKRDTYVKPHHETGHTIVATVHHAGSSPSSGYEPTIMTVRNSSGWQSSDDRHNVERYRRKADGSRDYDGGSGLHDKKSALEAVHHHLQKYEKDMSSRGEHYYESFDGEEGNELTEAKRGRPRKNPLPAGKTADDEEGEANLHIINQLRKAQISMTGNHKVTFHDGSSHHVAGTHAATILDKYAGMKPHEKEAFQKKIGASHKALMSEV